VSRRPRPLIERPTARRLPLLIAFLALGVLMTFVLWLSVAAPAHAAASAQAIANLNAQRAANGIPAGITENPSWSAACAAHNNYQRPNGGALTHSEDPAKPGYTPEGAMAASKSVLSRGDDWNNGNPWETAPIHLHQLIAPRLSSMGVDDSDGYVCATTLLGRDRPQPAAPIVYTYPDNGTVHRFEETAAEGPYTPGMLVGVPAGTLTGPYLYVMIDGPWSVYAKATITAASLTGPDGPVAIKTVDNTTPGLVGYLPTGGELIPLAPLRGRATYTVSVTAAVEGSAPISHQWSFSTQPRAPLSWATAAVVGERLRVRFDSSSSVPAQVTLTRVDGAAGPSTSITPGQVTELAPGAGTWRVCYVQLAGGEYDGDQRCVGSYTTTVKRRPRVAISKGKLRGRRVAFTVKADAALRGRRATVLVRRLVRRHGTLRPVGPATHLKVGLRPRRRLLVARPARGQAIRVQVSTTRFTRDGVIYTAARASRTYRRTR
jgi:hypothetical protein